MAEKCAGIIGCEVKVKVKVKQIPLQAWTGPERSMKFRLPDFKTICI
jgi:hypothetical protein